MNDIDGDGLDGSGFDTARKRVETALDAVEFAARTVEGDARDFIIEAWRTMPRQWQALPEAEQREWAGKAREVAHAMVRKMAAVIAAEGRVTIGGKLVMLKLTEKGIEGKLLLSGEDLAKIIAMQSVPADVRIVISDPERFAGERGPARIDHDQPGLSFYERDWHLDGETDAAPTAASIQEKSEPKQDNPYALGRKARELNIAKDDNHFDFQTDTAKFADWQRGWDFEDAFIRGAGDFEEGRDETSNPYPPEAALHDAYLEGRAHAMAEGRKREQTGGRQRGRPLGSRNRRPRTTQPELPGD